MAAVVGEEAVHEGHRGAIVGGAEDHPHEGHAGADVDGRELVDLADALQVPDVEAVDAHERPRGRPEQAEAIRLVVAGDLGDQAGRGGGDRGRPREPALPGAQPVGDQVALHGGLGDGEPLVTEPVGVLVSAY